MLAAHFAAKGYELYGKKDSRFLEAVYGLLRKEFSYRPQLTRQQFFNMGYAERKLIFLFDVIQACKTLNNNLSKTNKNKKTKKKPNSTSENHFADTIKKVDIVSESQSKTSFVGMEERQRSYSPEIALASLWDRKKFYSQDIRVGQNTPTPFPNPLDTYHHEYHDISFAKGIGKKKSTIESESILNHPPSYAFKAYIPGKYDSAKDKSSPPKEIYQHESILSNLGDKISNSPIPKFTFESPKELGSFNQGPIAFSSPRSNSRGRSKSRDYKHLHFSAPDGVIDEKKLDKNANNLQDKSIQAIQDESLNLIKEQVSLL